VTGNLAYDGVEIHNGLQRLRMQDVFLRRQQVELQKVVVLATAMMRPENQESVLKAAKRLAGLMFPEDKARAEVRDAQLRETLKTEGAKSYKVRRLKLGDR